MSGFVADLFRSRNELLAENALLRQQLIVASRKVKQPKFRPFERSLVVALSSVVKHWQNATLLVKPDTVLRWHREGFQLLWKRKSKATKKSQPRISAETMALIRDMAIRNKTWGAERVRGELLKLGIRVAKRTIQRHILAVRPPSDGQSWRTFLKNHVVWAVDFGAPRKALMNRQYEAAPIEGGLMRKGTAKLGWVPTAGLHQQSGLNCTGCEPFDAGRATAGSMVRQRIMRRKPLYLQANSQWLDGAGRFRGLNRFGSKFQAGGRETFAFDDGAPPIATVLSHQG